MAISLISTLSQAFHRRPTSVRSAMDHRRQVSGVPATTGPLSILRNKRVLVIIDSQNLEYSARDLGCKVSYRNLGKVLDRASSRCSRHVIFSKNAGPTRRTGYYVERGWKPTARLTTTAHTRRGLVRKSNIDFLLAFEAGRLAEGRWDIVLIGSGDGDLVEDVAAGILGKGSINQVATLSLAGSTASRLNAAYSPLISANIQLGLDCLRPMGRPQTGRLNDMASARWMRW